METDFFTARDGTQGLTHEARTLPLNHTPIARLCFVFSGLQDRDLFEIMRYIDILFHLLFLFYTRQVPKQLTFANTAMDPLFVLTIVTLEFRSSFLSPLPCFLIIYNIYGSRLS